MGNIAPVVLISNVCVASNLGKGDCPRQGMWQYGGFCPCNLDRFCCAIDVLTGWAFMPANLLMKVGSLKTCGVVKLQSQCKVDGQFADLQLPMAFVDVKAFELQSFGGNQLLSTSLTSSWQGECGDCSFAWLKVLEFVRFVRL